MPPPKPVPEPMKGHETLLLVEDNRLVARVAQSVLERVEDNVIFRPAVVKSHLFFLVDNDEGEASLWVTEGTAASTRALRFFHGKYPHDLVALV